MINISIIFNSIWLIILNRNGRACGVAVKSLSLPFFFRFNFLLLFALLDSKAEEIFYIPAKVAELATKQRYQETLRAGLAWADVIVCEFPSSQCKEFIQLGKKRRRGGNE